MKKIILFAAFISISLFSLAQEGTAKVSADSKPMVVDASCADCKFGMEGKGCVLAVKIDGKAYLVEGAKDLHAYGDAHGADGMCNAIRKAEVQGEIKGDKFVATSFTLLPVKKD